MGVGMVRTAAYSKHLYGLCCDISFESATAYHAGQELPPIAAAESQAHLAWALSLCERSRGEDVYVLRDEFKALMWEQAGLVRDATSLATAQKGLETLRERAEGGPCVAHRV